MNEEREHAVRAAAFAHLDELVAEHPDVLPAARLQQGFMWNGQRVPLLGSGPGIWKPAVLDAALSIMTTPGRRHEPPPYEDQWIDASRLSYAYRGSDPEFWQNRALRAAWEHQLPLVYFFGVERGCYLAEYPAYIARDRPGDLRIDVIFGDTLGAGGIGVEIDGRRYAVRPARQRLHQRGFRLRVLRAYRQQCAICRLKRAPLLDAAHIVPDGEPQGLAVTPNGLSLCKLHHAAHDQWLVGVRPDLRIEVAQDVLDEIDGPMLQHGLQELHGKRLRVMPQRPSDRPSAERLEWRYERFRQRWH